MDMADISLTLSDSADPETEKAILDPLKTYNVARFGASDRRELTIALRDHSGQTLGGLSGHTGRGWLYISLLFIPEPLRGRGLGPRLIAMAEEEAKRRGCMGAYIDTMNPDALRLYERCGFTKIGELDHFTGGHIVTWLAKRF